MSQIQRFFTVLFFASLLAIAGCSKSGTQAGLEKEDTDGDGIADIYDPDMDGDGIPNGSDPDIDGDGTPNGKDPSPGTSTPNYCDSIQVFGLNEEDTTGSEIVLTWYLQSSKTGGDCVLKEGVKADLFRSQPLLRGLLIPRARRPTRSHGLRPGSKSRTPVTRERSLRSPMTSPRSLI